VWEVGRTIAVVGEIRDVFRVRLRIGRRVAHGHQVHTRHATTAHRAEVELELERVLAQVHTHVLVSRPRVLLRVHLNLLGLGEILNEIEATLRADVRKEHTR
jgi:hypothetical protein